MTLSAEQVAKMSDEQVIEFPGHSHYYELSDEELILFEAEVLRRRIYTLDQMRQWHPALYVRIAEAAAGTTEQADLDLLASLKKVRRNAIRAMRKIYYGHEPCSERAKNPRYNDAVRLTEKANADCNVVIHRINARRDAMARAA
jgi:hypothetical protein